MPRGRPLDQTITRPDCPSGHLGHTVLDGRYRSPDRRFERPIWGCRPADGISKPHRFTLPLQPRRMAGAPEECEACERPLHRSEGHLTAHYFRYSVRETATMLDLLGRGTSYRSASASVRAKIGRTAKRGKIVGQIGNSSSPALHALDIFGPTVAAADAPAVCPRIVAIDAWPIRRRLPGKSGRALPNLPWPQVQFAPPRAGRTTEIGRVMTAVGMDAPQDQSRPISLRWSPGGDELSAAAFLRSLPPGANGDPEWVVLDRDPAMEMAVRSVWPKALVFFSEPHLRSNALSALTTDVPGLRSKVVAELEREIGTLFWSPKHWQDCRAAARKHGAAALDAWLVTNDPLAQGQFALRARFPHHPRSTGAAEAAIRVVKAALNDRRHWLANADRLDKVLALICAELDGRAGSERYSRILRTHLAAQGGMVRADWRIGPMDRAGHSSIIESVAAALVAAKQQAATRMAPAKSRLYRRNKATYAKARAAAGLAPAPIGRPRHLPASGSVAGMTIADFPWLLAEWHPSANGTTRPEDVPAGSGTMVAWRCLNGPDHEWSAQARSRAARGVRCPFCLHRRVAVSQSFATTHPDIAAEWHSTRNQTKMPQDFTFGSHFEAWWQCPKARSHAYQSRISSRTSMLSGCPRCALDKRRGKRVTSAEEMAGSAEEIASSAA